jgi:glycosyltransferase involved in cell wall biosynthesis
MATCHDLLAVRGALGEDTDCPASALGRLLQARVLAGLRRASAVACDSKSTQGDLARLAPDCPGQLRRVIPLGQNYPYRRAEPAAARASLAAHKEIPWEQPFLIHVGSNLPRKNKCAVIDVLGRLRERWAGNAVFCGAELNAEMKIRALANGVAGRVFALAAPSNVQLEAAYSLAHALVYPSTCEGFGWPVIEAQACGCPVISSDRTSLPEVGGGAALTFAPDDIAGMAEAVLALAGAGFRSAAVERGLANAARFGQDRMIDDYVAFYGEVMAGRGHA